MKRPDDSAKLSDRVRTLHELASTARRTSNAAQQLDEAVAEFLGLSQTASRCLDILEHLGPMPAGKLADEAGVTSGAITSIADQLEGHGYIQRKPDAEDRRKVLLGITESARELVLQIYAPFKQRWQAEAAQFSDQELLAVVRFLEVSRRLDLEFAAFTQSEAPRRNASIAQRTEQARKLTADKTIDKPSEHTTRRGSKRR